MKSKHFIIAAFVSVFSLMLLLTTAPVFAEDDHFLDGEHYFISKENLKQGWMYVTLATLKTPATPQTKNEAEFLTVASGEEVWTKFFWPTRVLEKNEIKKGLVVIMFEGNSVDDVYSAPDNKDDALNGSWFMGKITDISDLYKGYVTVSGGYKVKVDNLRVELVLK